MALAAGFPWTVDFCGPHEVRGRGRQLLLSAALAILLTLFAAIVIWASYGFKYSIFGPTATEEDHVKQSWESLQFDSGVTQRAIEFAREKKLLPEGYLYGFAYVRATTRFRHSYLNGAFSTTGFRSFFLYCLALKTPLTLFLLLLVAAVGVWKNRGQAPATQTAASHRWHGLYALIPLLALWSIFLAFAISAKLNIGHRHIMPIYPAMFVLAGAPRYGFAPTISVVARDPQENDAPPPSVSAAGPDLLSRHDARGHPRDAISHGCGSALDLARLYCVLQYSGGRAASRLSPFGRQFARLGTRPQWTDQVARRPSARGRRSRARLCVLLWLGGPGLLRSANASAAVIFPLAQSRNCLPIVVVGIVCASMLQSVYGETPGRWNDEYEELYQWISPLASAYVLNKDEAAAPVAQALAGERLNFKEAMQLYDHLRFGRLCVIPQLASPSTTWVVLFSSFNFRTRICADSMVRRRRDAGAAGD